MPTYLKLCLLCFSIFVFGCAHGNKPAQAEIQPATQTQSQTLTRKQYNQQVVKLYSKHDQNKSRRIDVATEVKSTDTHLQSADTNKDGKINILEFMKAADRSFEQADLDKNGELSATERKASLVP